MYIKVKCACSFVLSVPERPAVELAVRRNQLQPWLDARQLTHEDGGQFAARASASRQSASGRPLAITSEQTTRQVKLSEHYTYVL